MGVRTYVANVLINRGRKIGRSAGAEMKVTLSDHSIETRMAYPNTENVAWDHDHYKYGNVYLAGYANPIKPRVNEQPKLEDPDTASVEESTEAESEGVVKLMGSERYRKYMQQDLIDSLLNPREQWKLIMYGVIALGVIQFVAIIIMLYINGAF